MSGSWRVWTGASLLALALLTGCTRPGTGTPGDPADLLGAGVVLESATVDGYEVTVPTTARATLVPGGGDPDAPLAVHGVGGCDRYTATLRVDGDSVRLDVGTGGATEISCSPDLRSLDERYTAALARVRAGSWSEDRLTLTGDGVRLVLAPIDPVPVADLTGTTWLLDDLGDRELAWPPVAGADPATLRFDDDGTITAGTGCRTLTGRYELSGDEIVVTDLDVEGECAPDLVAQDEHVLAVLGDGFLVSLGDGTLEIGAAVGTLGLGYREP